MKQLIENLSFQEKIIAKYVSRVIGELRLVNLSDYAKYIYTAKLANIKDIIDTAAELYFVNKTLQFSNKAKISLKWDEHPILYIGMYFSNQGIEVDFDLIFTKDEFVIKIFTIKLDAAINQGDLANERLRFAFEEASLKKRVN